jgi:hypothetical protein
LRISKRKFDGWVRLPQERAEKLSLEQIVNKIKFKLVTKMPVSKYKCGLKSGNFVRLKKDIVVKDHKRKPTGKIYPAGEIWKVVNGSKEKPIVVWFRQADGKFHTWDDDKSIFDWFELIEEEIFNVATDGIA